MPTIEELKKAVLGEVKMAEVSGSKISEMAKEVMDSGVLPKKMENKTGSIQVTRIWKESGKTKDESGEEELIEIKTFGGVPTATVGFNCRMTLSLGNYETVQVGVNANVPCYVEEMQGAYEAAKKFVDSRLNQEIKSIRDYRLEKKKEG